MASAVFYSSDLGRSQNETHSFTLTNESGQVLYKASHLLGLDPGTTTIHKVAPDEDPLDMRDRFEVIGEIEWRLFRSSKFQFHGEGTLCHDLLHRHGIVGRKRAFTGTGSCPSRWDMLLREVVLSRDDGSKAEVARYRKGSLGIVGPKMEPRLDIDLELAHMKGLIILTFVSAEKICMDKEKGRRHAQ